MPIFGQDGREIRPRDQIGPWFVKSSRTMGLTFAGGLAFIALITANFSTIHDFLARLGFVPPLLPSLIVDVSSSGFATPLNGYPVIPSSSGTVFTGGFKTEMILRHNHAANGEIIVRSIYLEVLSFAGGERKELAHSVDADKIIGKGPARINELRVQFRKDGTCNPSWTFETGELAKSENWVRNMLDIYPPLVFQLGNDSKSDVSVIKGTFVPEEQGLYRLKLTIEYDSGSGQTKREKYR